MESRVGRGAFFVKNVLCLIFSNETKKSGSNSAAGWHNSSLSNTLTISGSFALSNTISGFLHYG